MGPLSALLSLPVSGPMSGLTWLARQIEKAALQEMLDPARIETALLALERRLEAGEIDEATFEAEEERLLEELSEITALRAVETETDEDKEGDSETRDDTPPLISSHGPAMSSGLTRGSTGHPFPPRAEIGGPVKPGHDGKDDITAAEFAPARQEENAPEEAWTPA